MPVDCLGIMAGFGRGAPGMPALRTCRGSPGRGARSEGLWAPGVVPPASGRRERCIPCVVENGLLPGRGPLDLDPGGRGTAVGELPRLVVGPGRGTADGRGPDGVAGDDGAEGAADSGREVGAATCPGAALVDRTGGVPAPGPGDGTPPVEPAPGDIGAGVGGLGGAAAFEPGAGATAVGEAAIAAGDPLAPAATCVSGVGIAG